MQPISCPKSELSETDLRDLGNLQYSGGPGSALKNPPPQDEMWQPTFSSLRSLSLRSCGRVVKAMDLKSIGVSPRRFEPCRLRVVIDLSF